MGVEHRLPVAALRRASVAFDDHDRGWRQFPHTLENGVRRGHHGMKRHVVVQRDRVDARVHVAGREDGRQGGGEAEARRRPLVIQRLDAQAVAPQHHSSAVPLPDRECEHAVEFLDEVQPPGVVSLEQHLCVAVGGEAVTLGPQPLLEFAVVVYLTVVDHAQAELRIDHRLVGAVGQVDDGQPPMSEGLVVLAVQTVRVGPAGGHAPAHGLDALFGWRIVRQCQFAADAAHGVSPRVVDASMREPSAHGRVTRAWNPGGESSRNASWVARYQSRMGRDWSRRVCVVCCRGRIARDRFG